MARAPLDRAVGYERGIRARPPVQPRSDAAAGDNYADVCPVRRRRGKGEGGGGTRAKVRGGQGRFPPFGARALASILSRVVARACWWTHLHNVAPIPIASGISMHSDGRSCACTLGVSPVSLFVLHARARERILVRTRAAGSGDGRG
jgi:hypothetical protein